jgi:hypothetical protein
MSNTRSVMSEHTTTSHKTAVREFLTTDGEVASKEQLRACTELPAWDIDQIASKDSFYTSVNHHGRYFASKDIIGRRSTHDGFWHPEVDYGIAVFHCH